MTEPYYSARDPRIEIICAGCRYHLVHNCLGTMVVVGAEIAGTYRCACTSCAVK